MLRTFACTVTLCVPVKVSVSSAAASSSSQVNATVYGPGRQERGAIGIRRAAVLDGDAGDHERIRVGAVRLLDVVRRDAAPEKT